MVTSPGSRALAAATLASLPGITSARLTALLSGFDGDSGAPMKGAEVRTIAH